MNLIKISLLFFALFLSSGIFAQKIIVIDKNKNNTALFDVNDPFSLISILSANNDYLGYYNIKGMGYAVASRLTSKELKDIVKYTGQPGTLPIIDEDPNSSNYGDYMIVTLPDGSESYVYDAPDTVYISFKGITRITFEILESDLPTTGNIMESLDKIKLWRKFDSVPGIQNVLTLNAKELMTMQGLKLIHKVDEAQTKQWTDKTDSNSLWIELKTAILERELLHGTINVDTYDGMESFFPETYYALRSLNFESTELIKRSKREERYSMFYDYKYNEKLLPFTCEYDSIRNEKAAFHALFDSCYYDFYYSDMPLIDNDPNSENFGYEIITIDENGLRSYVYPEPEIFYNWIDYSDIVIYMSQVFYEDENGVMRTKIGMLYFAKDNGADKPALVAYMKIGSQLEHHLKDYQSKSITDLPWHIQIQKEFDNKFNHYDLSKPEDVKRFNLIR